MPLASKRLRILATVWLALCTVKGDDTTIVDLGYAKYQGMFNETSNTTTFLCIRYAAPPVGNRFHLLRHSMTLRAL